VSHVPPQLPPPPEPGSIDDPLPRRAARILLVDGQDRLLLFRGFDPARPGRRYWFTAGGGLAEHESSRDGAARELREETGLAVDPGRLGEPVWHETTDFPYDGRWYRQEQDFYVLRVETWDVDIEGFDVEERRSIDDHRWWSLADLTITAEQFYPQELPTLLRAILEG
jgi:8-oxo-dGTP pyrophosphatase MutT (NUDIX family)